MHIKKILVISISTILLLEVISYLLIAFPLNKRIEEWHDYHLPQRIISLSWFEKSHQYHPFLGYMSNDLKVSMESTEVEHEPSVKIGIVGGSFALMFARFLKSEKGREIIKNFEKSIGNNVNIKFLNFASGGFRQPQQLLATVLYQEKVDFFVSIEGFNELVTAPKSSCAPFDWNMLSARFNPKFRNIWFKLAQLTKKFYLFASSAMRHSNLLKVLWYFSNEPILNLISLFHEKTIAEYNCDTGSEPLSDNAIVNHWMSDIKKHHNFMSGMRRTLFTVMQPNQYDPSSKKWSDEEQKLFSQFDERKEYIEHIYPLAGESLKALQKEYPNNLLDFRNIYKNEKRTVYSDGCCHVNNLGNEIFATHLFRALKQRVSWNLH